MSNLKLLTEWSPWQYTKEMIEEAKSENGGKLLMKGVLQKADTLNQNGRVYPRETLMREADQYSSVQIKERRALGELDHPDSSVVNLQNASHNILEMHWSGDDLSGTVEVLGTPAGNILKELFKSGIKLGISSRGLGSVKEIHEDDSVEVQPDFELIAFDFVSNPSTQGAFMHPLSEGVDKSKTRTCGKWCKIESIINNIMRGE